MDIFDKIERNRGPLGQYQKDAEGYFMFPKLEGEIGPYMEFKGRKMLNWSLNNYLGLANHPEVRKADAEAAAQYGLAYPMGARMMSGQTDKHEELEQRLARFVKRESAYVVNYGYQAMVSIIDTLLSRNDVVVYDSEAHACIIDGLRLHMGKRFVYPHNNMQKLEKELERASKLAAETKGGILVITEGVFGMSGDLGKLDEIVALKKKYNFRLLIDDAHGFGTMGPTGAGTDEHFGVQNEVDIYFGTFAKSMALIGGFVAARKDVVDYLRYNMRSQIFAKSLPMACVIGALKRLDIIETDPSLRKKLWDNVNALQKGLKAKGLNLGNSNSPVTPVFLSGNPFEATAVVYDLRENYNIFCSMVTYPVVPKGVIMLRLIPTAAHSPEDIDKTVKAFAEVADKLKAGKYQADKVVTATDK
ncbi:MAG: aminotransferase class I/II-fold pyridoxal phosphate-dependent enzyme [Bacteroidales bacterium]|nr:aminotransferase class I/II-fold pyridoxal phosphate-dependent enzyme [Bacteroidales bacterium]